MTEPTAEQIIEGVADSMVDIAIRGGLVDEVHRRVALSVVKDNVSYNVTIMAADAEARWEDSLPDPAKLALILFKISLLVDEWDTLAKQGYQTHHLLHLVADKVGVEHHTHGEPRGG